MLLDHDCGFRRNRLTTGHVLVLCIRKILEKNGKIYELQRQLSVDFKKGCVSVCFILLLSLVYSMTLVSCVKIRLNESCNKVLIVCLTSRYVWCENGRCFIASTLYLCFRICHR